MISKRVLFFLLMAFFSIIVRSCVVIEPDDNEIFAVEINEASLQSEYEIGRFDPRDIELIVTDEKGNRLIVPLEWRMITSPKRSDLDYPGNHIIDYDHMGFAGSFSIRMAYPQDPIDPDQYDLIVFSGQSHMQGYPYLSAPEHAMAPSAIEYFENEQSFLPSSVSNGERIERINPYTNRLFNCTRPSGSLSTKYVDPDDMTIRQHDEAIASSIVPHFTKAYESYGKQSFVMHIAEGATAISEWLGTDDLKRIQDNPLYEPILEGPSAFNIQSCQDFTGQGEESEDERRVQYCQRAHLGEIRNDVLMNKITHGIDHFEQEMTNKSIENKVFVWNQGERDAAQMVDLDHVDASKALYKESFLALWQQLKQNNAFDLAVIMRLGLWNSLERDLVIMAAQEELAREHEDIIIGTRAMGYMPHYTYDDVLGHGKVIGYWADKDIAEDYLYTRDTYWVGGHNNRHVNDRGNRLLGERTALNVFRKLSLNVEPDLETERIPEIFSYLDLQIEDFTFDIGTYSLEVGQSVLLDYTTTPNHANRSGFSFESVNPEVATVNAYGVVLALGIGETTIVVRNRKNELLGDCSIEVRHNNSLDDPHDLFFLDFRSHPDSIHNESELPSYIEIEAGSSVSYDEQHGFALLNPNGHADSTGSGWLLSEPFLLDAHETDLVLTMAFETYRAVNTRFYTSRHDAYYGKGVTWFGGMQSNFTTRFENESISDNQNAWRPNQMDHENQEHAHIYLFTFRLSTKEPCGLKADQYQRNLETGEITLLKTYDDTSRDWVFGNTYGNKDAVITRMEFNRLFMSFNDQYVQSETAWVSFFRLSLGAYDLDDMVPRHTSQSTQSFMFNTESRRVS